MASHWFDWRNAAVHYAKSGWGDPLLMVHDLHSGASSEDFDRNVRFLSNHFTVFRLDLVGFGLSDGRAIRYSAEYFTDLIGDFVDQVIGAPAHAVAVGQSCGFIAGAAVEHPERFSKLIFISPEVAAHDPGEWTLAGRLLREAFWLAMVASPMRSLFRQVMTGEWEHAEFLRRTVFDPHCIDSSKLERLEELAREPHALSACASLEAGFLTVRLEDFLPHVTNPTRFICGSESGDKYLRTIDRCASMIGSSDVQRIPSARLWPHYEKPRQTNELLLSFLNDEVFSAHAVSRSVAA